jgi:SAM-dependent methyltransferase
MEATDKIRDVIPGLLKQLKINSFLDLPCGDFNWMKHINLSNINYIGADIVPELIDENIQRYAAEKRRFLKIDIVTDQLPKTDIVFSRDCFVHLSNKDIKEALKNIKNSGATYLLTTNFTNHQTNEERSKEYWRPINLEKPPFNLPPPILIINEGYQEPQYEDKSLTLWKINELNGY